MSIGEIHILGPLYRLPNDPWPAVRDWRSKRPGEPQPGPAPASRTSLGCRTLQAWTAGHSDLTGCDDQELALRKLVSMVLEHRIELLDLSLQGCTGQPEEEDAGVGEAL